MNFLPKLAVGLSTSILLTSTVICENAVAQTIEDFLGTWTVSEQSSTGSSLDSWDITFINNNQLSVVSFKQAVPGIPLPGDYRQPLQVRSFSYDNQNQNIYLTLERDTSWTTEYVLTFVGSRDRLEGQFRSVDTKLGDLGIIQGQSGTIHSAGKIIMTRQQR